MLHQDPHAVKVGRSQPLLPRRNTRPSSGALARSVDYASVYHFRSWNREHYVPKLTRKQLARTQCTISRGYRGIGFNQSFELTVLSKRCKADSPRDELGIVSDYAYWIIIRVHTIE